MALTPRFLGLYVRYGVDFSSHGAYVVGANQTTLLLHRLRHQLDPSPLFDTP